MMVSLGTATFPSKQAPPFSAVFNSSSALSSSRGNNLFEIISSPKGRSFESPIVKEHLKVRICLVNSDRVSSLQTHQGFWEDPDDGSGSEYDDEVKENDFDFESDWEEERDASSAANSVDKLSTDKYEEDLLKAP